MLYQLTYELKSLEKDYTPLYNFLEKGLGGSSIHVLRDSWWIFLDKPLSISELCDRIHEFLDEKDLVYISEIHKHTVNGWMPMSHWNWLSEHEEDSAQ